MICNGCFHKLECSRKPTPDDRCDFYVKGSSIELDDNLEVNPVDTLEFNYDDIKKLIKSIDPDSIKTLHDEP